MSSFRLVFGLPAILVYADFHLYSFLAFVSFVIRPKTQPSEILYFILIAFLKCLCLLQEQTGKQRGALERPPVVSSGTDRVGDTQGHRTHWTGTHWWGRGLPAETTGKSSEAHQNLFLC